jgi:CRP/FNR family transcriptional regulator, cyclic AMP receptor protein
VAEAGTVVGVAGLSERARGVRVVATMPSLLCLVALEAFEGVARRNPEVGLRLVRVLGERIGVLETRLAELAHGEVTARLAGAILRLMEGEGVMGFEGARLPTRYTHRQLGSMIGANREAVTRALGKLRRGGVIEVRERRIHVVDLEALRRAARQA